MLVLCLPAPPAPVAGASQVRQVDLELVLAVDASDSIDDSEWRLQLTGIANAFRSEPLQYAIAALPQRRIAVALLVWADGASPKDTTGWRLIDSGAAAQSFADEIDGYPRRVHGGTGIGEGVAAAIRLIAASPYQSGRQVIDVSGDGVEPPPIRSGYILMSTARFMAEAAGITINGLAIMTETPYLYQWYRDYLMTGSRAFVMAVRDLKDFDRAFLAKLLRELEPDVAELDIRERVTLR